MQIMKYRKLKDLTQRELAHEMGVSRSTLAMWECGTHAPPVEMLVKLADFFDISLDDLVGRTVDIQNRSNPINSVSDSDTEFINLYRTLTRTQKRRVSDFVLGIQAAGTVNSKRRIKHIFCSNKNMRLTKVEG